MPLPRPWLLVLLAALAYAFGHISWYALTPLGRVPVLDELENVTLAQQIADGTLPPEPFYRAMGYPLVLAGLLRWGVSVAQLPLAALLLGVGLHAAAAVLVAHLARRWFDDTRAGLVAGLLAALNPVFVHYATQRLDASLGVVCFLGGLLALAIERSRPGPCAFPVAAFCWTLAALVRPQFLTALLVLPAFWFWSVRARGGLGAALAALALCAGLFIAQGLWQRQIGGEFRLLPWQGAYNLWAANQPGAHGRYYAQSLALPPGTHPDNPAKLESLALYTRETGQSVGTGALTPASIDAMNAHWRTRFLDSVREHPLAWLGRLLRRGYAFLNNWEQYNNKTYAFHAARSPWLAWNPLGWGVLLVLATAGMWRLGSHSPATALAAGGIALAVAAGIILCFVSARFRLPVAVFLCVPAGGALARPAWFQQALSRPRKWILAALVCVVGATTFSDFDGVRDARPFIQDHLLAARAAQVVGEDRTVWSQAIAALAIDSSRRDASEYVVTSGFNRQLAETLSTAELVAWRASAARLLVSHSDSSFSTPGAHLIAALAASDIASLRALTTATDATAFDALGVLALLGGATVEERLRFRQAEPEAGDALFFMARQTLDAEAFAAWAASHRSPAWSQALALARERLFASP